MPNGTADPNDLLDMACRIRLRAHAAELPRYANKMRRCAEDLEAEARRRLGEESSFFAHLAATEFGKPHHAIPRDGLRNHS